ncbi:MAG: hypothetical protein CMN30_23230 [Sandaracinus sp.]|nr:hypothetical protein [Sandaracinus sp.]
MTRLVFAALLALSAGCAGRTITLETGPRSFTPDDYEDVYESWTRDDQDFEWALLDDVLHVTATFESWEFRWAYVVRYGYDHAVEADDRETMLRATLSDAGENHRFYVTVAGSDFREQNLASRHSAWRVLLVDPEGRQTEPVEIERIRRPSAADEIYFPSITPQRQAFRVVFPASRADGTPAIPDGATHVILRFTGARGRVDLRWDFGDVDADEPLR